jgi:riboflavin synthase
MFSGIVQELGEVISTESTESGFELGLEVEFNFLKGLRKGDSIAINGVCLTVIRFIENKVWFDVIHETIRSTNLGDLRLRDKVNLERSLCQGDEIGGHLVSGHISGKSKAILKRADQELELVIQKGLIWGKYIFNKGCVAINGVSLTIARNKKKSFSVFLIPETIDSTNLAQFNNDIIVNIEVDSQVIAIVETTESFLKSRSEKFEVIK